MAGSVTAARRLAASFLRHAMVTGSSSVVVAEIGSRAVGFAELSHGGDLPSLGVVARSAIDAMGFRGALGAGWRSMARRRVELPIPAGGVHLVELQVSPQLRNHGVGAFLLKEVAAYALDQRAATVSLTTATDNPARRLYQRHGYRVVDQRTNARYERITGSAGRILMVKSVDRA